jgi:hypothetical protein
MDEKVEHCPYCVLGDDFRLMVQRPGWFICENCGHIVIPDDPGFRCSCRNCPKVRRAA